MYTSGLPPAGAQTNAPLPPSRKKERTPPRGKRSAEPRPVSPELPGPVFVGSRRSQRRSFPAQPRRQPLLFGTSNDAAAVRHRSEPPPATAETEPLGLAARHPV